MAENILSVGIDIGTSTTSLVFSNLRIEKTSGDTYMPKTEITDKTVIYRSSVYFTPLKSNTELDAEEIRKIIEDEYAKASISPEDVETGAVIITGDTARKANAENVLVEISRFAGDFVVATAGPDLESILAGKGSGAEQYSIDNVESICNMDIGGGTTNISVFYDGKCVYADCLDIGGRLIRFQKGSSTIEYIFPKIMKLAKSIGINAEIGVTLKYDEISRITDVMAKGMMGILETDQVNLDYEFFLTKKRENQKLKQKIDAVSFSGGVGKLIYEDEEEDKLAYSDIGVYLADSIKRLIKDQDVLGVKPKETISATVIGAGNHSVDVSGGTITITQANKLPLKNIPIINVEDPLGGTADQVKNQIEQKIRWIQGHEQEQNTALNLKIDKKMKFADIVQLAERIVASTKELMMTQDTLVVIVYGDYGKVLGQSISVLMPEGKDVICIDSIDAGSGDYIDIGKPVGVADSVPVVVKTIAFNY